MSPTAGGDQYTHVDILVALAKVEGKIDALTETVAQKRGEMSVLDGRVRALELRPAMPAWVIAAMGGVTVIAFFLPFVIDAMNPSIQLLPETTTEQPK